MYLLAQLLYNNVLSHFHGHQGKIKNKAFVSSDFFVGYLYHSKVHVKGLLCILRCAEELHANIADIS